MMLSVSSSPARLLRCHCAARRTFSISGSLAGTPACLCGVQSLRRLERLHVKPTCFFLFCKVLIESSNCFAIMRISSAPVMAAVLLID